MYVNIFIGEGWGVVVVGNREIERERERERKEVCAEQHNFARCLDVLKVFRMKSD